MSNIVVLDRDGVINEDSANYIKSADEWQPIAGAIEAIAKLKQAGYLVAIATNQSGIGRGYYSQATLDAMHAKMHTLLAPYQVTVDCICYCPHIPADQCDCRKPKTGLLDQIEAQLQVSLHGHVMVGDSLKDLQVAVAKNMQPVLVKTGKGTETLKQGQLPANTVVANSLAEWVNNIL